MKTHIFGLLRSFLLAFTILTLALVLALLAGFIAPAKAGWFDAPAKSGDVKTTEQQERALRELSAAIGLPNIVNGFEKRMVKMLYEMRDDPNFRTYTYIVTMDGQFVKLCDSVGFGINASIQYSNPDKIVDGGRYRENGWMTMPQAEPNGLFMPEGLAATYVMCVDAANENLRPVYVEPEVIVSPFPMGG